MTEYAILEKYSCLFYSYQVVNNYSNNFLYLQLTTHYTKFEFLAYELRNNFLLEFVRLIYK